MDLSLFWEVLVDQGYLDVLEGCLIALVLLLILRKIISARKPFRVSFSLSKEKVFLEEEFEASIEITALRRIMIEELSLFVECLTQSPEKGSQLKRKSHFFKKNVVLKDVHLYPKCRIEEKVMMKIPEKDKEEYLPGTFTSLGGQFSISWQAGYSVKIQDMLVKTEKSKYISVYPVCAGW